MRQQVDVYLTLDADAELDTTRIKNCIESAMRTFGKDVALVGDIQLREEAAIYGNNDTECEHSGKRFSA